MRPEFGVNKILVKIACGVVGCGILRDRLKILNMQKVCIAVQTFCMSQANQILHICGFCLNRAKNICGFRKFEYSEFAKSMKDKGMEITMIVELTGLTPEEIEAI